MLGITLDGASVFAKILIGAPARGRPCYRKRDFSSSTFANERFNLTQRDFNETIDPENTRGISAACPCLRNTF